MSASGTNGTYSGWQREKGGAFFGLDGTQTVFVGLAAVMVLVPLLTHSWAALVIAVPITALLVAAALVGLYLYNAPAEQLLHLRTMLMAGQGSAAH